MGESINETSSLDARNLLALKREKKEDYPINGNLAALWDVVDSYIQFLAKNPQTRQALLNPESQKQYDVIRKQLQKRIITLPGFDPWKIVSANTDNEGFLILNLKGGKVEKWNIVSNWNDISIPKPSTESIHKKTQQGIESLDKSMEHESYL